MDVARVPDIWKPAVAARKSAVAARKSAVSARKSAVAARKPAVAARKPGNGKDIAVGVGVTKVR